MKVADLPQGELDLRLQQGSMIVHFGPLLVRIQSRNSEFNRAFRFLYGTSILADPSADIADFVVQLRSAGLGLFHWLVNGLPSADRDPSPASLLTASFEWAVHSAVAGCMAPSISFHAGVAADEHGRAVALVGESGSGKSTLTAGLVVDGWRLVADEFLIIEPSGQVVPMPGPITLKQESIEILRQRAPALSVTQSALHSLRGQIAHMVAPRQVAQDDIVDIKAVVFPTFVKRRVTSFERIDEPRSFQRLVVQSHNRHILSTPGFKLLCAAARIPAWSLRFSNFDEALEAIRSVPELRG